MLLIRLVGCVLCLAAAHSATAQVTPSSMPGPKSPASSPAGKASDIDTIDPNTPKVIAVRLPQGKAPKIDGRLNDEVWALAPAAGSFIQREPHFGAPATEPTEFKILYDDRMLYLGIWCFESDPKGIIASELKRDAQLAKGDRLKINIDSFHDHRNALYFGTSPLGTYKDAEVTENGRNINYDWNVVWELKTSRDEHGWYAEFAIPFNQLRFRSTTLGTTWGLNVCRIISRKNEETNWSPFPRELGSYGFLRMQYGGHIIGLEGLHPHRQLEVVPFVAPRAARDYDAGTSHNTAPYGFDLRLGLSSNLAANLTYKTDFAQVEADQEVVNTSRFSLFFPEKRQFFTESAGIFDYGRASGSAQEKGSGLLPIFYSRSIGLDDTGREVPLIGGARIAGRTGKFQVGLMNVETDEATFHSGTTDLVVPRANYTVIRAKRNILSKSSIGGMFLNRQGSAGTSNEFNRAVGADLGLTFGSSTIITGMLAKTFTPDTRGKDTAGVLDLGYKVDAFNGGLTYIDVAEKFNAEMGYIPRVDIRNPSFSSAWTPRPKWRGVRQVTLGIDGEYFGNHAGQVESRAGSARFSIERQDGARFSTSLTHDYDFVPSVWAISPGRKVPVGEYAWDTFSTSYSVNSNRPVYGSASVSLGGYYGGTKRTSQFKFNFVTLGTLLVENVYTRNDISLPGYAKYATTVLSTRVSYSFSPDLFVKSFVQYNNERRTASLNFLLWYVYRPGSDLYIVYNGGWETDVPGPRQIRPRNRSLAIKMTYWLAR